MSISLKAWHGLLLLGLLCIWLAGFTTYTPYRNNHFKPHRWRTDICKKNGVDADKCTIAVGSVIIRLEDVGETQFNSAKGIISPDGKQKMLNNEVAYYDICLEHGEWARIK